ncbi:MAG: ATP-binding cassette domain-containing protein [Dehalococcoidia bacterium]|nr:ATP-binding cassette domain-containing protein [Dehalococcoidia bacterium]
MPAMIEAHGLVKTFGDFRAVDGIDFRVEAGEFFGMLGPNGAGKTSTIRMISCVVPITAGALQVDGLDVRYEDRAIKARLGVVPQDDNLDQDLSVRKNLEVYARYYDVPKRLARERIDEGLELMQLQDRADERISALSGGMKRRLVVARALVNEPRLLILDEPTTGLDPQARHLVWRKLRLLRERGVTILLTTHYMDEAEHLCDRLIVMDHGRALDDGRPRTLIERYVGRDVLELHLNDEERARVRAYLDPRLGESARVEQIEDVTYVYGLGQEHAREVEELVGDHYRVIDRRANLEDVFLTLTGRALVE